MSRGDHTGPEGLGPGTGRRMGYCAGYDQPGFANATGAGRFGGGLGVRRHGRGFGMGPGRGLGRGPAGGWYQAAHYRADMPISPENRRRMMQEEIETIDQHIQQLNKEKEFLQREVEAVEKDE